jgi:hypothetical protein
MTEVRPRNRTTTPVGSQSQTCEARAHVSRRRSNPEETTPRPVWMRQPRLTEARDSLKYAAQAERIAAHSRSTDCTWHRLVTLA